MPLVIPIFIPHEGCPHTCIFCNQHRITGKGLHTNVTPTEVQNILSLWLDLNPDKRGAKQAAFYGGSFTGLPVLRQKELLEAVVPYMKKGQVDSIRLSTRPDYVNRETVNFLKGHGVATVELGVQSLDNNVLEASYRGHKACHTYSAVRALQQEGMEVGLQLMLGLPGQSFRSLMQTAKKAAALKPDFIRIYPVLVLEQSTLHKLYAKGKYRPLSLEKAVAQAGWMKKYFDVRDIRIVRMGLQAGLDLEESLVAGPYHPSFGELVSARIMFQQTRKALQGVKKNEQQVLSISDRDLSIFKGMHSNNILRLKQLGLADRFTLVTDNKQPRFTLRKSNRALINNSDA